MLRTRPDIFPDTPVEYTAEPFDDVPGFQPREGEPFPPLQAMPSPPLSGSPVATFDPTRRPLFDAHCHVGLMANAWDVVDQAAAAGLALFSMGTEPEAFRRERAHFHRPPNVQVGLGLHPWYVEKSSWDDQLYAFERALPDTAIIGEVGLDFGPAHVETRDAQLAVFARILQLAAVDEGRFISIHAVNASSEALDLLEESGAQLRNTVAFHWFSGTSDDLQRAIRLGARFSVSARMLATKRGRSYARAIPADRLLLETDAPAHAGDACSAAALAEELCGTGQLLESIRRA